MARSAASGKKKTIRILGLLVLAAVATGIFMGFGPPGLYARSGTPDFCAGCHVMQTEYESWMHAGAHRRIKCIDCHLPNDNLPRHLTWKSIDGMWDVFVFYSGRVPETIRLSQHGATILQENCKRCHAEIVSRINEDRDCWQCHRRLSHRTSGTM
jgi:cytochrome c nitrite reductase small subunit